MKNIPIFALLLLAFTLFACNKHTETEALLSKAELQMDEHPNSALILLQELDTKQLTSADEKALYALLYSQALDKNYIDITDDSLINIAVDYYKNKKSCKNYYFSSLFYKARVQYNRGDYVNAIITLTVAEELIPYINDNYKLALLYSWKGHIHNDMFDATKSLSMYKKAKHHYSLCNQKALEYDKLIAIADAYCKLKEYDQTEKHIQTAIKWAYENKETSILQEGVNSLIILYENLEKYDKLDNLYKSNYLAECDTTLTLLLSLSRKYAYEANTQMSKRFYERARQMVESKSDSIIFYERMRIIHSHLKEYKDAAFCANQNLRLYDREIRTALTQPIATALNDYYIAQIQYKQQEEYINRLYLTISVIAAILLTIALYVVYKYSCNRVALKNAKIESLIATVNNMEHEIKENKSNSFMEEKVHRLFAERFSLLNKLCTTYYETSVCNKERDSVFQEVKREMKKIMHDKNTITELESLINDFKENILSLLYEDFPNLSNTDRLIFTLLLAGFSAKAISAIIGINRDVIYAKKSRLKKQILLLDNKNRVVYDKYFT